MIRHPLWIEMQTNDTSRSDGGGLTIPVKEHGSGDRTTRRSIRGGVTRGVIPCDTSVPRTPTVMASPHRVESGCSWAPTCVVVFLCALLLGACSSVGPSTALSTSSMGRTSQRLARVTTYWARGRGSDSGTRRHRSATGVRLVNKAHVAVDPKVIPYGSKVILPTGDTCVAVDTGGDVKNRKAARHSGHTTAERCAIVVDLFFESRAAAVRWASTHPMFMLVKIILPPGVASTTNSI